MYVLVIGSIIFFMIARRDTSIVCIAGIFILALVATTSFTLAISSLFNSFIYAISELLPTILIISIIVSMSKILSAAGINQAMVAPFAKLIKGPGLAFWIIGLFMMVISWFFWPSPAVALVGAVLMPAAIRAGLPALGAAMAMNLFGHGIALSSDFIIQGAPKLTADAAGLPVETVIQASIPLVIVMGAVTTISAFLFLRKDMKLERPFPVLEEKTAAAEEGILTGIMRKWLALTVLLVFTCDVAIMFHFKLQGGDATALIGGTAILLLLIFSLITHKGKGFEKTTAYLIEGFQFGFRVFAPVIPIAAFFYLGDAGFGKIIGDYLPHASHGIVNDLGAALASAVPIAAQTGALAVAGIGAITGLDGSGFSGISLVGSVAQIFGESDSHTAVLTALGQISAIWVGGGTLVPWALIPAAAICGVDPFELARRNLIPVLLGLAAATITAIFML
nr:hypothetical protein [Metabacillus flavus]